MPVVFPSLTFDLCLRWLAVTAAAILAVIVLNVLLRKAHVRLAGVASIVAAAFSAAIIGGALFDDILLTTPDIWVFMLFGAVIGLVLSIGFELAFGKRSKRGTHLKFAKLTILMAAAAGFLCGSMIRGLPAIASLTLFGTIVGLLLALPDLIFAFSSPGEDPQNESTPRSRA